MKEESLGEDLATIVAKLQEAMTKNQGSDANIAEKDKVAWSSGENSEAKQVTST